MTDVYTFTNTISVKGISSRSRREFLFRLWIAFQLMRLARAIAGIEYVD